MRWKNKELKPAPKVGDKRKRFPYAWLPTYVEEYVVWLEWYVVTEEFRTVAVQDDHGVWPVDTWVEVNREVADFYYG